MLLSRSLLRHGCCATLLALFFPLQAWSFNSLRGSVSNSGVYSIDYATLRSAGFSTPENVGARGLDGPIPVAHRDGRIIMWIQGLDNFTFHAESSISGYFENSGRDIFCKERDFILTDNPRYYLPMEVSDLDPSGNTIERGVIFTAHEKDLQHNSTSTGNVFWGENLNIVGGAFYSWNVNLPEITPGTKGRLSAQIYSTCITECTLHLGQGADAMQAFPVKQSTISAIRPSLLTTSVTLNPGDNTVSMEFDNKGNYSYPAGLDYWVLSNPIALSPTYLSSLPLELGESDCYGSLYSGVMGFPALRYASEAHIVTGSDDIVAFDITTGRPVLHPSKDGKIAIRGTGQPFTLSFCNLSKQLPAPKLEALCEEERLLDESLLTTPADLLIISPRRFAEKSRELADIHRENDGMAVTTVTLDAIYDHFSGGNTSIAAVRELIKSVKGASGGGLKNVLLIGPMSNNIRLADDPTQVFIAPQASVIHPERGAYFTLDRYVIGEDTDKDDPLMRADMDLGIAILPFESESEADRYISKIREYLSSPFSLTALESILWIGGEGDNHTHETQTQNMADAVTKINGDKTLHSMLPIDAFGYQQARKQMFDYLDAGKTFTIYIGHASESQLGKINNTFLSPGHLLTLQNIPLTFVMTAGCSATKTDSRLRGLAEHMILTSERGAFGGLVTTRETWSSQNYNFLTNFFKTLYGTLPVTTPTGTVNPPTGLTIGESYAYLKTTHKDVNELAFTLMCDPALKIPVATNGVKYQLAEPLRKGGNVEIEGEIVNQKGKTNNDFNGRAMLRLLAPPFSLLSKNLTSGAIDTTKSLIMKYDDRVIAEMATDVRDGRFKFNFPLPDAALQYAQDGVRFYFTAFDDTSFKGAAAYSRALTMDTEAAYDDDAKRRANISSLEFEPFTRRLSVEVDYDARRHIAIDANPEIRIDDELYRYEGGLIRLTGDDGYGLTYLATIPSLKSGDHTVEVALRDVEGHLISFTGNISTSTATSITLSVGDVAVRDEILFTHDAPAEGATQIVIENGSGVPVCRLTAESDSYTWDRKDNAGRKVAAGIYRCYLRHAATDGTLSFSAPTTITLL